MRKLKTILLSSLVISTVLPVIILGTVIFSASSAKIRKDIINQNYMLSSSIVEQINYFMSASVSDLEAVSYFIEWQGPENDIPIEKIFEYSGRLLYVAQMDSSGIVRRTWPENRYMNGMDMSRRNFITQLKTPYEPQWSSVSMSPVTGYPSTSLSMIISDGFVTAFISLKELYRFVHDVKLLDNSTLFLIDDKGIIIASNIERLAAERENLSDIPLLKNENNGITMVYEYKGAALLGTAFVIPGLHWHIVISQPVADAFRTNNLILFYFCIGIFIIVSILMIVANIISRKLNPLQKLVSFMEAVGESHYNTFDEECSVYEVELLRNSYNAMSGAINARENNLKKLIIEKNILLKEVNHRVKNNLIMISGLFSIQREETDNSVIREILSDAGRRIESMALVHTMMYKNEYMSKIPFKEYLEKLIMEVRNSYQISDVMTVFDMANVDLPLEVAIPVGLIVNELLTNIFKHAFSSGNSPEDPCVAFRMSVTGEMITLSVSDNGAASGKAEYSMESGKLGMKLIYLLTKQINGEIRFEHNRGTKAILTFPVRG